MEPDSLKELLTKNFLGVLHQNLYTNQADDVHNYLNYTAVIRKEIDDYIKAEWTVTYNDQQSAWEDYKEELNDKDLGIVRKINLK